MREVNLIRRDLAGVCSEVDFESVVELEISAQGRVVNIVHSELEGMVVPGL